MVGGASDQLVELEGRWNRLCQGLKVERSFAEKWWHIVRDGYQEKQRHYHTLAHLQELFALSDNFRACLKDVLAVELAIFFHDVVYDPRATGGKNEIDSAVVFSKFAQEVNLASASRIAHVYHWIVQTKDHVCAPEDEEDCKFFMDFDMAVLGWAREEYAKYTEQVRQEYIHVPQAIWCDARAAFLEATARSDSIFATEAFKTSHEKAARANLFWEAAELRNAYARLGTCQKALAKLFSFWKGHRCALGTAATTSGVALAAHLAPTASLSLLLAVGTGGTVALAAAAAALGASLATAASFVRHPYPAASVRREVCIYAGSFNPPHFGHLECVRYLASAYGLVHVVIGVNPLKKYPVDPFVRRELLRAMLDEEGLSDHVQVSVVSGYIWRFGYEVGADRLFRGMRSWKQDGAEEKKLEALNIVGPLLLAGRLPIRTAYLQANPRWNHVSSTLLRDCIRKGTGLEELVPPGSAKAVKDAYAYLADSA